MGISRREFVERAAILPIAARLSMKPSAPRITVVGAGSFGGWTALHLRRLGAQVTLLDAWGPGNPRASSGGETRVIRAIYGPDRIYVEMVKRAYELWEQLDPSLYTETGALWLHRGDDAYVRSSIPILHDLGFPVDRFTAEEASKRWPQIRFDGVKSAYLERRAGALYARRACGVVRDAFVRAGGTYRTEHVPLHAKHDAKLDADVVVYACGPWLPQVRPTRQEVFYFGPPRGSSRYQPGSLPVWIDFGERIFYGLPDLDGAGFKIADDTRGEPFDPTSGDRTPSTQGIARARSLLAERFPELANAPLLKAEVCQYENSADGQLIVDRRDDKAWVVGGGSGHGFKLSPAVGELVAQAILNGREVPKMFRLDRDRMNATQWKT